MEPNEIDDDSDLGDSDMYDSTLDEHSDLDVADLAEVIPPVAINNIVLPPPIVRGTGTIKTPKPPAEPEKP